MSDETPLPWDENDRAQRAFAMLEDGNRSTLELQDAGLIHPARQIWELRHWYGCEIVTHRLPNGVGVYELVAVH